jgi:hypothetical protein
MVKINWNIMDISNKEEMQWGKQFELLFIGISIIIAGFIAKIPQLQGVREDLFYKRNVSFIFFPLLIIYFNWKNNQSLNKLFLPLIIIVSAALYINWLPNDPVSNSITLSYFHLPIMIWVLLGYTYIGGTIGGFNQGIGYLRFTADLLVMSVIILLSGFLFMAMTMGLFKLIGIDTAYIVQNYMLIWGLPSIPIIASYLVTNNPQIVNKISPIIAKIFTPMVTLMLFLFLFGIIVTGKNPSKDREFLFVFNGLLIGVMALIIFSLSEMTKKGKQVFQLYTLLALSSLTILINGVALYAIVFRLIEFGFSANRIAVMGADVVIFVHLLLVAHKLYLLNKSTFEVQEVEKTAGQYLPIYFIWTALVVFLLPLLFGFK